MDQNPIESWGSSKTKEAKQLLILEHFMTLLQAK